MAVQETCSLLAASDDSLGSMLLPQELQFRCRQMQEDRQLDTGWQWMARDDTGWHDGQLGTDTRPSHHAGRHSTPALKGSSVKGPAIGVMLHQGDAMPRAMLRQNFVISQHQRRSATGFIACSLTKGTPPSRQEFSDSRSKMAGVPFASFMSLS